LTFLPSPLVGEGGASRSEATGEGFSRLDELCENVLQYGQRLLQYVIVPVTRYPETFGRKNGICLHVTLRRCVLTTVDFNNHPLVETDEVENKTLKWDLPPKFKDREPSVAKQTPHRRLSVGSLATHHFCEIADALGGWSMVWRLRHEPLTRRPTSFGATLSHRGRGKEACSLQKFYTRIGIST